MVFKMIHDIYGVRNVEVEIPKEHEDDEPMIELVEEEYVKRSSVVSEIWIDKRDIRLIAPQFNKQGNKYKKRVLVTTIGDNNYVLRYSFKEMVTIKESVEVNKNTTVGFK